MLLSTLMFLEILLEKTLTGPIKSLIQIVVQQINMLLSLVNDSLDLAAMQDDAFEIKQASFSPKEVIEFVVKLFQPQGAVQNTTITVRKKFHSQDLQNSFSRLLPSPDSIDKSQLSVDSSKKIELP